MSSFAGYCDWCSKPVMHKTLFGTLHVCITPEEHQSVVAMRAQQQMVSTSPLSGLIAEHPWLGEAIKTPTNNKGGSDE